MDSGMRALERWAFNHGKDLFEMTHEDIAQAVEDQPWLDPITVYNAQIGYFR